MVAIISVSVGRRINFGPFAANYKRNQQDKEVKSMTRIDIISGFLGAGKTTLIKKLLGDALKGQQVVLIENEFGEIGIDGGFLKDAGIEIREMNSGCICCSLVGDFGAALKDVITKYHPDRIIIEPDAEQPDEFIPVTESVEGITDESSKLYLVKAAGIVGMGGAGFPTGVKLNINLEETPMGELDPEINPELPKDFKLDCGYILVNAAECEPGLEHNTKQIEEQSDKLIRGIKYSMEITHAKKAIIAIKKKHHKAIKVLQKALENEPDIKMHLMADIYPMGEERAVVRECLGVLLTTTQLPSAARSVVINVETVCKIAEAVDEKKPCISKNMTVRGKLNGGNEAHVFFDVPGRK